MKKTILSIGLSSLLCTSLFAFDYTIHKGEQFLGAVEDITNMNVFKQSCVDYIRYVEPWNPNSQLKVFISNEMYSWSGPQLTELKKGAGFILNANADCTVSTDITFKGLSYKTVKSPTTGKVWLDRNIGATKACGKKLSEYSDYESYKTNESACFGDYFQWGRGIDGHEKYDSMKTNSQLSINTSSDKFAYGENDWSYSDSSGSTRISRWLKTDGSTICPEGFRVPHADEVREEIANFTNFKKFFNGPMTGYKNGHNGELYQSTYGSIWTATKRNDVFDTSIGMAYDENVANMMNMYSWSRGIQVRCIQK